MKIAMLFPFLLAGCGGLAWNTTVADHPQVRQHMLGSLRVGQTTEKQFTAQWGNPTQKIREGAQVSYVYRNMKNPKGYYAPQFGDSSAFVVVAFQYGLAVGGYSSDSQGCRATFAPRPPGHGFDNPTTVHPVNCGVSGPGGGGGSGGNGPAGGGHGAGAGGGPGGAGGSGTGGPRSPADASRWITDQTYGTGKTPKPAPAPATPATPGTAI